LNNPNYVKKVVFPLEILPWIAIGSALFHGLVSLLVWLIFYLFLFGIPSPVALLFPAVVLPLILLTAGLCWFLAALGVYVRDTSQLTTILTTVLMFLSPIFYPASALPENVKSLLLLNPLAPTIEHVRGILIWNSVPNWNSWIVHLLGSLAVACLGFAWFQKTRRGFADVI
jgi:lipopolysaccharide transport system permease protein